MLHTISRLVLATAALVAVLTVLTVAPATAPTRSDGFSPVPTAFATSAQHRTKWLTVKA